MEEWRTVYGWILRAPCLICTTLGLTALGRRCCCYLAELETESWEVNPLAQGHSASQWWNQGLQDSGACGYTIPQCLISCVELSKHFHWFAGGGQGVVLLSLMWPRASCFSPLYLVTASLIFLPSCHLSFPHKLPFSGDSVISSCSDFWGRMGSNSLGHKGCLYCWSSLSSPRPMGLSPQSIPEPLPSG